MNHGAHVLKRLLFCATILAGVALFDNPVYAQAGLRESLERLDKNENGMIEPDEITPLARPYLEQISRERRVRLSLHEPMRIDRIQEAARLYHALRNGVSGDDVRPEGESTVKPLRPDHDQPLVPEFGLAQVKFPYTQDDLDFADRTMRSHDRNRDGYIDRAEAARNRWTHRNPFADDLNKDERLSRLELTQRYARRRLLSVDSGELRKKAWRTGSEVRTSDRNQRKRDDSQWWRRGGSGTWLTASVMGRFDLNRNGRLELPEVQTLGIPSGRIDVDRDGEVSREELQTFMTALQEEAGDLTEGLPGWFYELDANRDGQVTMNEFATEWTNAKHQEFALLDTNDDGFLTSLEVIQSKAVVGGSYRNENAEVLPPRRTIISEIEVEDDFVIGDLNVEISITHSNTGFLDAYLTSPGGQRVELFTEVGGGGDHFDKTVLDDQSRFPITKAKPPFKGTFQPEALGKRQPGLSSFNGKSVKGVWQLVVRGTRSERFGMLHSWGLTVTPREGNLDTVATAPTEDGPQPGASPSAGQPQGRSKSESSSREPSERRDRGRDDRGKYDREAVYKQIRAAVAAGEITEEDAKKKTSYLEEQQRKKKRDPKDIAKDKQRPDGKKGLEGQKPTKGKQLSGLKDLLRGKKPFGGKKVRGDK